MLSLSDLQDRVARAVIMGDVDAVSQYLVGGADPRGRLGIHRRHYETSLITALCDKFPATAWLVGADVVAAAAREYIRAHPPSRPCIAEYGGGFPEFLSGYGRAAAIPYLKSFAELERAVGDASIAIDLPPLQWSEVANVGPERLLDLNVTLQPGAALPALGLGRGRARDDVPRGFTTGKVRDVRSRHVRRDPRRERCVIDCANRSRDVRISCGASFRRFDCHCGR